MKIKRIVYSVIAACAVLTLTGCNQNDGTEEVGAPTPKVEIRLGGSVTGVEPRSVINNGQTITAQLLGRDGAAGGNWSAATHAWTANGTFTTSTDGNSVRMADKQYYNNENADKHTYILGIYPSGTLQGNKVTFNTLDGQQDVMLSQWVDAGCKSQFVDGKGDAKPDAPQPATMTFEHCTAQLYFDACLVANEKGGLFQSPVYMESITLKNVSLPQAADISVPAIEFTAAPADLSVAGINSKRLYATAAVCGNPVMINASGEIRLDIAINVDGARKVFSNVLITKEGTDTNLVTEIGKRHKVSLAFKAPETPEDGSVEINISAVIKEWVEGDSGSNTLQ